MKYTISADLNSAIKQTAVLTSELNGLGKAALQASGYFVKVPASLNTLSQSLAKTAVEANKLDSSLGKGLAKGSNQAVGALLNLGRVVQDAPFGFIGIANNINPLLESFQRLKAETGTTGSALKALGASLIGGGGLGLAVSIGTAALSLFGLATRSAGKEAKEAAEKTDEYAKKIKSIAESSAAEIANVSVLVEAYKSQNLTQGQRIEIIDQLKRISPEYFNQLKSEKTSIDDLSIAYANYARNIEKSVIAEIKKDKLKTLLSKKIQLEFDLGLLERDTRFESLFNDIPKNAKENIDKTNNIFRQNPFTPKVSTGGFSDKTLADYQNRLTQLNKLSKESLDLAKQIGAVETISTGDIDKIKADKVKIDATEIAFVSGKVNFDDIFQSEGGIGFDASKLKFDPTTIFPQPITPLKIPVELILAEKAKLKLEEDIKNAKKAIADGVANSFQSLYADMLGGIGEAIGAIASGADSFVGVFKGILSSVGDFVIKLGKAAIQTAIIAKFLKQPFKNPVVGIAAGIAAIALGTIIKAATSSTGFADGGYVSGPGSSRSDSVPARLSNGEYVLQASAVRSLGRGFLDTLNTGNLPQFAMGGPSNNGSSIGGGQNLVLSGETITRGQDLLTVWRRATQTYSRIS